MPSRDWVILRIEFTEHIGSNVVVAISFVASGWGCRESADGEWKVTDEAVAPFELP